MKSFKSSSSIRKGYIIRQLQNTSFDTPIIGTGYTYYGSLSPDQKNSLIWICGGNILNSSGPVIIHGTSVWGMTVPFPLGNQCIGIQADSFIQQSFHLVAKTYKVSFFYHTRSGYSPNPINVLVNGTIIGTIPNVAVNSWTYYSTNFTINVSGQIIFKIAGSVTYDVTTAVNNIIIS